MKNMYNKGFTLVEIMVVIVIMGVLAAVAVPKLFGNIAKAKASEIAPAASIYQKLQDVYHGAHGTIGNWSAIGYIAPGGGKTTNFTYCSGDITENIADDKFGEASKIGWQASNNTSLNGCTAGQWWFVSVTPESGSNILYTNETSAAECVALAKPSWTVSSRTGMSCGEAGSVAETALQPTDVGYTMTMSATRPGGWRGNAHQEGSSWLNETKTAATSALYSIVSTYNENDPTGNGFFILEKNSVYTFTIANPDGEKLQTDMRIYTAATAAETSKDYALMCGSINNRTTENADSYQFTPQNGSSLNVWSRTGETTTTNQSAYSNAEQAQKYQDLYKGIDAVAVYDKATNTTTFTIRTGDEQAYFGANVINQSHGLNQNSTAEQRATVENAVQSATLTKIGESDDTKTAKDYETERLAKEKEESSK